MTDPRPILKFGDAGSLVIELKETLRRNGYTPSPGDVLDSATIAQLEVFQLQHLGPSGEFMACTGLVDADTWWALDNATGEAQRSGLKAPSDHELTPARSHLLDLLAKEHAKPVFEVPDGSNGSPDIDGYWGNTGVKGLAWCCAFVSTMLKRTLGLYPIGGRHHTGVQVMWFAARDLGMAVTDPKPGDVFIQIKSQGQGHTGFVVGVSEDGQTIFTCEGNCGNRLKMGRRARGTIDHFIDCIDDRQSLDFTRMPNAVANIGASEATR
jgi:hypothetical protein